MVGRFFVLEAFKMSCQILKIISLDLDRMQYGGYILVSFCQDLINSIYGYHGYVVMISWFELYLEGFY